MQIVTRRPTTKFAVQPRRSGAASLEYVLVLAASLPMLAASYYYAVKIIRAVYEMTCALICWPFM
jgi:hypothetical protein